MNDATPQSQDVDGREGVAARRALFGLTAAAGLGALGLATSSGAEAATVPPLLLGRANNGGRAITSLTGTAASTMEVFNATNDGRALQVTGTASAHGMITRCMSADRWAEQAVNWAGTTGTAGAVLARGRYNVGLRAETMATAVPAVVADGAGGAGVAMVASGETYLDGDAMALRNWVGVLTSGGDLGYAPVSSSDRATHTITGQVTLDGSGNATVTLPDTYLSAIQRAEPSATPPKADTLMVSLTPFGGAMPNLYVATVTGTGFTIAGGTASGKVTWVATADRLVLQFDSATAAGAVASAQKADAKAGVRERGAVAGN